MTNEKIKATNEMFYSVIESLDLEQIEHLIKKLNIYVGQKRC